MTEDEAAQIIRTASAATALAQFAEIDEPARRQLSKPVAAVWKAYWKSYLSYAPGAPKPPEMGDDDALRIALLATAIPSELKPYHMHVLPRRLDVCTVMGALRPSWLDRYVAALIDDAPHLAGLVAPLWRQGLCTRPEGDGLILAYYAHGSGTALAEDEPGFASHDVWRFFEVEGGGELSLASHDKYTAEAGQWSTIVLAMCREGALDRARLLDASLDALERDFGQFRVGWYARLHGALTPTEAEMAVRTTRYLRLLASPIPPTVSFAMKALRTLDKAGALTVEALLAEIGPALQARQKATVTSALQLLGAAAKRAPERSAEIAGMAATALIHEAADVQAKALDLVERLDAVAEEGVQATLAAHLDAAAPSLRPRLAAMLGTKAEAPAATVATPDIDTATPVAAPVAPVDGVDAAIALFLDVLETCRDPIAVERAIDGIARFGAAARSVDAKLSPVAKRGRQLLERGGTVKLRLALAATGVAWAEGEPVRTVLARSLPETRYDAIPENSTLQVFLRRNDEVIAAVHAGRSTPMLSLPSDETARVDPGDLVDRLAAHRAGGHAAPPHDLALALLRLGTGGREAAVARLKPASEAERATAFALGADAKPAGDPVLWVGAWAARAPDTVHPDIRRMVGQTVPDAGTPATLTLTVEREGRPPYFWCRPRIDIAPEPVAETQRFASSLRLTQRSDGFLADSPCSTTFEDIAWSSILWPGRAEPFFACAIRAMDTDQKLTDHFCLAYLEPLFRPGATCGPMALAALAYYLASADKAVTTLTVDAIAALVERRRLSADDFAAALQRFIATATLPFGRWVRGLRDVSAISPAHAAFVRAAIAALLRLQSEGEAPREFGAMLELLFELHCAAGTVVDDPDARERLSMLDGGGKTGTFARKLLKLSAAPAVAP
ncbi:MAG: DUF6493 family protein [Pseudomonadota bacterium]